MAVKAVWFAAGAEPGHGRRLALGQNLARALSEARRLDSPAAYVVPASELAPFRELAELVVDRGRKHEGKGLAAVLLGQTKIPLILGSHKAPGQLVRSVRDLLENAVEEGERNVYIIGAEDGLFDEVWQRADAAPEVSSGSDRPFLDLLPKLDVPPELARRYVGESAAVRLVHQLVVRAARHKEPVLILGDTGTGKEVVAQSVHEQSVRGRGPFVPANCAAIPRELFESVLFGHEPGSFTGAERKQDGLWKLAQDGTLFLDEIGDLSFDHQVKILRALEERKIRPTGAGVEIEVNARVIAATNSDLFSMVRARRFREDLYYRLCGFPIRTPALRDHPEDIPMLAQFFWRRITGDEKEKLPESIVQELLSYLWPGNVRELKMVLTNLYNFFGAEGLGAHHLTALFRFEGRLEAPAKLDREEGIALHRVESLHHLRRVDEVIEAVRAHLGPVVEKQRTDRAAIAGAVSVLEHRLHELDFLCSRPLLFNGEITFSMVARLKDALFDFFHRLRSDPGGALRHWQDEVKEEIRLSRAAIFQEVERLMGKG